MYIFLLDFKQKLLGKAIFLIQTTMIQFNLFTSDLIFLQFQKGFFLYVLHYV